MVKKFYILLSFFAIALNASNSWAFETDAEYAILVDYDTDTVLFEKKADEKMHPSSMTKLMTAYIVFDKLSKGEITLETEYQISKKAWQTFGTKMFVMVDEKVKVSDLIQGAIVQSGNDACIALAEGISGDEDTFASLMNQYASELGLSNSHFANSNGLNDPSHMMSARDIAKLSKLLIERFPQYYHYFGMTEFTFANITQPNKNLLIGEIGVDGMKTGSTPEGGYGISISAQKDGRRLIGVVNGLKSEKARKESAQKLLQYGFGNFEYKILVPKGYEMAQIPVWYGANSKYKLVADRDYGIMVDKAKSKSQEVKLKYSKPLMAPVKEGDKIAELIISDGNQDISYDLTASENVKKSSWFGISIQNMMNKLLSKQ